MLGNLPEWMTVYYYLEASVTCRVSRLVDGSLSQYLQGCHSGLVYRKATFSMEQFNLGQHCLLLPICLNILGKYVTWRDHQHSAKMHFAMMDNSTWIQLRKASYIYKPKFYTTSQWMKIQRIRKEMYLLWQRMMIEKKKQKNGSAKFQYRYKILTINDISLYIKNMHKLLDTAVTQ